MKSIFAFLMVLVLLLSYAVPAYSVWHCAGSCRPPEDRPESGDCLQKLGRGFSNCLTFIMEVPQQISNVNRTSGPLAGFTWGLVKGIGMAGVRAAVGAYEVVTFPLPCPEGYKPILTDPEYFFADNIW